MVKVFDIAVFEGDGIGPEITAPVVDMLAAIANHGTEYSLSFTNAAAGARHYARTGHALPEESLDIARNADAILLSAMGDPAIRYEDGTEIAPQIDLRIELDLYAGVRPVRIVPGQPTPLALPAGQAVDFVLVRESTEGLFHSKGIGEVTEDEARETMLITRKTSEKLFRFAFNLAEQRKKADAGPGRVTCIDKANVFRAFAFFRSVFDEQALHFPDIAADHAYVDAAALWMVQKPWMFDVMVTENMFGDILSDLGAGLMGGLGMAPSADIGDDHAVFQPCHGSAPDIAGKGIANPFAMILSAAMMLDWLAEKHQVPAMARDGQILRNAVYEVVSQSRWTTKDIGGNASTIEASNAVTDALTVAS
ncbi:MAG: isocitrate/isopropylmalate dehydrogenase family protein [Rhizobiaceae bacterium]